MAEWLKAPDSKSGIGAILSEVRILPLPQGSYIGEVAEWFKATVLKTVVRQRTVSSNLTLSALKCYTNFMVQTIDLRQKESLPEPPRPPAPEVVLEEATAAESVESDPTSWTTHHTRSATHHRIWYVIGALVIGAAIVGIFAHDIIFSFVLGLGAVVLLLNTLKSHRPSHVGIHATGISINDDHHRFADMRSFWIHYYPPHIKELSLEFKKGLTHRIQIPIENQNPLELRQVLMSYVPEKEHEPSLLDHLIRMIGI